MIYVPKQDAAIQPPYIIRYTRAVTKNEAHSFTKWKKDMYKIKLGSDLARVHHRNSTQKGWRRPQAWLQAYNCLTNLVANICSNSRTKTNTKSQTSTATLTTCFLPSHLLPHFSNDFFWDFLLPYIAGRGTNTRGYLTAV